MIPESTWQAIWDQENPKGWFDETFDARTAATRGDMTALKLVAKYFPQDFEVRVYISQELCFISFHRYALSHSILPFYKKNPGG